MSRSVFDPESSQLPGELPVFPLSGVLLLPGAFLPLNIFEPRYLAMVRDALADPTRMIGIVQPSTTDERPELASIGCAGRISSFSECGDGRYEIMLYGVCRFRLGRELSVLKDYRCVVADWTEFLDDLEPQDSIPGLQRDQLIEHTQQFLKSRGQKIDNSSLKPLDDESLVNLIACHCNLPQGAHQQLLEAGSVTQRSEYLMELLQWSAFSSAGKAVH